jgi:hypothetical protein
VIKRLEEIGISSFEDLSQYEVDEIMIRVSDMLNSTCWKNSPQATAAIGSAISLSKEKFRMVKIDCKN